MHQKIILLGFLGREPEMRYTPGGQAVTSFSVATSRRYTSADGEAVSETTWWRVAAWGKLGETCHTYLKKGAKVYVEGRIVPGRDGNPRIWTGQGGEARATFEVSANLVRFLNSKSESATGGEEESDGEIPF